MGYKQVRLNYSYKEHSIVYIEAARKQVQLHYRERMGAACGRPWNDLKFSRKGRVKFEKKVEDI